MKYQFATDFKLTFGLKGWAHDQDPCQSTLMTQCSKFPVQTLQEDQRPEEPSPIAGWTQLPTDPWDHQLEPETFSVVMKRPEKCSATVILWISSLDPVTLTLVTGFQSLLEETLSAHHISRQAMFVNEFLMKVAVSCSILLYRRGRGVLWLLSG